MEVYINQTLCNSITDIIKYQNNLLIKKIAEDYHWDIKKLKKYIKDPIIKEKLVQEKQKKKVIKKVESKSDDSDSEVKILKSKVIVKRKKKKLITKIKSKVIAEAKAEPKVIAEAKAEPKVIAEAKAEPKVIAEEESPNSLLCKLIEFEGIEYYLDPINDYVYQRTGELDELEVEFVGMLEGKIINFDAESVC